MWNLKLYAHMFNDGYTHMFHDGYNHMWSGDMSIYMFLWWMLLIVIFVAIVLVVARSARGDNTQSKNKTPEDIAKERYAKGEIDSNEYKKIIKDIREK